MDSPGVAAAYAVILWWLSTGAVLYLVWLPKTAARWGVLAATVMLMVGLAGVWLTRNDASVTAAYVAFTSAILIWAWHELLFLLGDVTGPRPEPCPPGASEPSRFMHATQAILYHELAIAATAVGLLALTWGTDNQIGAATFSLLWVMRLSVKLNIFLGIPRINTQFLPQRLDFLKSYFRYRPMNLLFPVSVTLATGLTAALALAAADPAMSTAGAVGLALLATFAGLAVLEHWLLVVPLPDAALWTWALREEPNGDKHLAQPAESKRTDNPQPAEPGGPGRREPSRHAAIALAPAG